MGIYYQDIIKVEEKLFEDLTTALECARADYDKWCTVSKSYTELRDVFRDDATGEIVIKYKYDDDLDESEREDRFSVEWMEIATSV
jgi:hypothetical protein